MRLGKKEYELRFSSDILFTVMEKYDTDNPIEIIMKQGKEGIDALCWLLAEMSRQAELYRRYMGEEAREYLTEELVRVSLLPSQLQRVRGEIADAVLAGMQKEEGTEKEVDLGLQELQKKTESD